MNTILNKIITGILMSYLIGCGSEREITKLPQKVHSSHSPAVSPMKRNVAADYYRDDFDFNQFKGIDWRNPASFGEPCAGLCVGPTKNPIPAHAELPEIGIVEANYYMVSIKGDGSCWLRAAIQAVLFQAFQDQKVFKEFIATIKTLKTRFAPVPGFSTRFKADDLIDLLTTLNSMSPKGRLAQFNKTKVDLFLEYSMRALLHADEETKAIAAASLNSDQATSLKKLLTTHSWSDQFVGVSTLANLLLPPRIIFGGLHNFDFKNPQRKTLSLNFVGNFQGLSFSAVTNHEYGELQNDHRSLAEVENEHRVLKLKLKAKSHIIVNPAHPEFSDFYKLLEQDLFLSYLLLYKTIAKNIRMDSWADFHRHRAIHVLPYRQYDGHANLMVHKDAAAAFGY